MQSATTILMSDISVIGLYLIFQADCTKDRVEHDFMIAGYIQPQILKSRFASGDKDGFLDRHWVSVTTRKKTYFRDIVALHQTSLTCLDFSTKCIHVITMHR